MPQFTLPDTIDVMVSKINETRRITLKPEFGALVEYLVKFAAKQVTANSHAAIKREAYKNDAEFKSAVTAAADAKIAELNAGTLPGGTKPTPVTADSATAFLASLPEAERVAFLKNLATKVKAA